MLPKSHFFWFWDWLNLLEEFRLLFSDNSHDREKIFERWQNIQDYLHSQIMSRDETDVDVLVFPMWQSWLRETRRYVRLVNTELLFWQSSVVSATREKRKEMILQHLQAMIDLTRNNQQ